MNNAKLSHESFFMKAFLIMLFVLALALTIENRGSLEYQLSAKSVLCTDHQQQTKAIIITPTKLLPFNIKWTFGCEDEFLAKNHRVIKEIYSLQNLSRRHKFLAYIFLSFKKKLDNHSFITSHFRKEGTPSSLSV